MKNQTKFLKAATLSFLVFSLAFTSCKKAETGPAGAAGPQGAAGSPGAAGTPGAPGTPGNANVKNSSIFINANEWIYTSGVAKVTKVIPEITADIVNNGAVMVYTEGSPSGWEALPTTQTDPSGFVFTFGYTIEAGKLHLLITYNTTATLPPGTIQNTNIKIVLIAGAAKSANPNVNYSDYKEVVATFGGSE